jgi:hypothetical protein
MVPHPKVALERLLVGHQQVVIRGNSTARTHMFERLELGQHGIRQGLRVLDQLQHLLLPLGIQRFPVFVVVEGALLELSGAARDLLRVGHRVAADVHPAVDDPMIDAERGRQAMHPRVGRTQRAVGRFRRYHVERGHGFGKVHGIVEPEFLVVGLGELDMVRIGRLRSLGSRYDFHRAGQRELPGLELRIHSELPLFRFRETPAYPKPLSLRRHPVSIPGDKAGPCCERRRCRSGLPGAPAFVISLAYIAGIGYRRHLHPNVELFVPLNRGFPGAAAFFAPHQGKHVALVDAGIDYA